MPTAALRLINSATQQWRISTPTECGLSQSFAFCCTQPCAIWSARETCWASDQKVLGCPVTAPLIQMCSVTMECSLCVITHAGVVVLRRLATSLLAAASDADRPTTIQPRPSSCRRLDQQHSGGHLARSLVTWLAGWSPGSQVGNLAFRWPPYEAGWPFR